MCIFKNHPLHQFFNSVFCFCLMVPGKSLFTYKKWLPYKWKKIFAVSLKHLLNLSLLFSIFKIAALLRSNSHIIRFTLLKVWILVVFSILTKLTIDYYYLTSEHFYPLKKKPHRHSAVTPHSSLQISSDNHESTFCFYGFTYSEYFL